MTTFAKLKLSGSTDGRMIKAAATATPGTLLHTAHATALDEVWLYGVNSDSVSRKLTIEWGGVTAPDDDIEQTLAPEGGLQLLVPGLIVTNSVVVRAFAASANLVLVAGFVNRIT